MDSPGPLVPFAAFTVAYVLGNRVLQLVQQSPPNRLLAPVAIAAAVTVFTVFAVIFLWWIYRHMFRMPRGESTFAPSLGRQSQQKARAETTAAPSKKLSGREEHMHANDIDDYEGDDDDDDSPPAFSTGEAHDHLWTIHNKRYDLSSFVDAHPGGRTAILLGRGRDCTALFETYHSLTYSGTAGVSKLLHQYYVCDAAPGDRDFCAAGWKWNAEGAPFYTDVVREVREYFGLPAITSLDDSKAGRGKANGSGEGNVGSTPQTISRSHARVVTKATLWKWLYNSSGAVATLACLVGVALGDWVSMIALPFAYWMGPSSMMHDGCHFSLSSNPTVNRFFSYFGSAHMSPTSWNQQHTVAHHTYTNEAGHDPDLYHFSLWSRHVSFAERSHKDDSTERGSTSQGSSSPDVEPKPSDEIDCATPGFRTTLDASPVPRRSCGGCLPRRVFWRIGLLRIFLSTVGPSLIWDFLSFSLFPDSFMGLSRYDPLMTTGRRALHFAGRALVIGFCFILPLAGCALEVAFGRAQAMQNGSVETPNKYSALAKGIGFAFLPYLVHGAIFYAFSQVSHIQQECFDPQPHRSATLKCGQSIATSGGNPVQNADSAFHENRDQQIDARLRCGTKALGSDVVNHDWAISQVAHTADYSCSSDLWLWLSNGLNHQTAHHLFPGVDWCHHKALTNIIKVVARKHGVKFVEFPTFSAALSKHFRHLVAVNDSSIHGARGKEFLRQNSVIAKALSE